ESPCAEARVVELVVVGIAEADRDRLHRLMHLVGHGRDDGARVDAAGEKGAQWHLAHEAYPRRFPDVRSELLLEVTWRHARQLAGIVDRPVPLEMLTVGGHGQRGCWRELADRVEGT